MLPYEKSLNLTEFLDCILLFYGNIISSSKILYYSDSL